MLLVGEAWGEQEEMTRQPFVGSSGQELWRMLGEAWGTSGIGAHQSAIKMFRYGNAWIRSREDWLAEVGVAFTNVLNFRPPSNNIEHLCCKKAELPAWYGRKPIRSGHSPGGNYLRPEYLGEVERLACEIAAAKPTLLVACGNTACWALLRATNIGGIRGSVATADAAFGGGKCLPTYHPAGVLRNWAWRTIVVADLMKAKREGEFAEIRRPRREVTINPTIEQVCEWVEETVAASPPMLAVDVETGAGQIKCIGFARGVGEALVVPFVDLTRADGCYWPRSAEYFAWCCVKQLLESDIPKVFQNGPYDLQYILPMGIRPSNCTDDTMFLHHSLFPEMLKGLGFLGSIYTDEASWKLMNRPKADTEKKDE